MPKKTLAELLKELDFDNITPEQRLEGIKLMNEQMVKAGLAPMTPDEMVALSKDMKSLERFKKAKKVRKTIDEIQMAHKEIDKKFNEIPAPLKRSIVYLYDISGTKEAKEKNKKLGEKLSTIEGQREIFRNLFQKMKQQDLGAFYTPDIDEQIDFLSTDTKDKMFMFETDNPHAEFNKYDEKIFGKEDEDIYLQIKGTIQGGGQYQDNISATSNPISLFLPELSSNELMMLYVSSVNDLGPEIGASISNVMNRQVNLDSLKHSKTVYNMLNRNGFFEPGYGVYAIGQGNEITRAMGIDYLSDKKRGDITFYKYKLGDKDRKPIDTIKISEQDILNHPETKRSENRQYILDTVNNAKFTGTPTEVKFKQAVAIALVKSGDYKHFNLDTIKKEVETNIKFAESGEHSFKEGLQALSNEEKEKIASKLNDEEAIGNYMRAIKALANEKRDIVHVKNPGSLVFKGIFNPKIDGSDFVKLKGTPATIEKIESIQKEAEQIVIPTDTFNEKEASYIVFSEFVKPEYISKGYIESTFGVGSTLPAGFDAYDGGLTNFFQNTVGNDDRDNMHVSRLYTAQARKDAIELIEKFKSGDKQPLADSMKLAFTNCLGIAKSGLDPKTETNLAKYTSVIDLYDILQGDKFKGLVSFSEEEKQFVEFFRQEKKIVDEYRTLREEIIHESIMKQANGNSDLKSDRALQEKIIKLNARTYFLERQETYITAYTYAMAAKFGALKGGTEANKRSMFEIEKNFLYDPEAYMKGLEDHFRARENEFISIGKSNSYLELAKEVGALHKLEISKPGLISDLAENEELRNDISQRLKQFEDTAKYAVEHGGRPSKDTLKVIDTLKNLPCMKEDFPAHPTPAEIDARINAYKQAMEILGDEMYDYIVFEDGEPDRNSFEFATTFKTAVNRLESAKGEYILEGDLKAKAAEAERAKIKEEYNKANGRENEQLINEEEVVNAEPQKFKEGEFNRISKKDADKEFGTDYNAAKTANERFKDKQLTELLNMLTELQELQTVNPGVAKIVGREVQAEFDKYIQNLNEQMMDSDDPMLEEKLHITNRLSSSFEMSLEARDLIPEALDEKSPYREAYKNATEMVNKLRDDIAGFNYADIQKPEQSQWYLVTDRALIAMEHIKEAIENEAYNLDGPKIQDLDKKDLMAVIAHQAVTSNPELKISKAALKSCDKTIDVLAKQNVVQENVKSLDIRELNQNLKKQNGFADLLKEKPKVKVEEHDVNVKQIDPNQKNLF